MGEIIVVRSLTDSDLGIFAAHRASARSKQRAININSPCAARLLTTEVYHRGRTSLDCIIIMDDLQERSARQVIEDSMRRVNANRKRRIRSR